MIKYLTNIFIFLSTALNLFSLFFIISINAIVLNILHNSDSHLNSPIVIYLYEHYQLQPFSLLTIGLYLGLALLIIFLAFTYEKEAFFTSSTNIILTIASICTLLTGLFIQERYPRGSGTPASFPKLMERNAGWPIPFVIDNAGSPLHDMGTISFYDWYNRPQPLAYLADFLFFAAIAYIGYRIVKAGIIQLRLKR